MKLAFWMPAFCALAMTLVSCTNFGSGPGIGGGSQLAGTGPFDENGNYIEAWADNPSKWRKSGGGRTPHELGTDEIPQIAKSEQPPQNSIPLYPSALISRVSPSAARNKSSLAKTATKTAAKSTPKAVAAKSASTKSAAKSTRDLIKPGDSLSSIASRNGCSVSALKSANGITGSAIRAGRSLTIPRK